MRQPTQEVRERLSRLAWLLDSSIPIPGTGFSIGLEALIGLFPVVGDLAGVLLSSYILKEAAALGVSRSILARMAFNVALEGLVGMTPFAGDVFDAAYKANQRNVRLLNDYLDRPAEALRASRLFVASLVAGTVVFLVVTGAAGFLVARWIWTLL
ncbi:MAG: hypothetical protein A3G81_14435 [Betaproteobacteria bacterium RIFCSPLOWO2_12_FULL_65_14]|nr:MAG: hypothetical protein A3G81_14435 [Betaproteobacteria bacterium RIFCSPLOWO2_12_FULL_65_14]